MGVSELGGGHGVEIVLAWVARSDGVEVAVQRRTTNTQILGNRTGRITVGLHTLGGGDVLGVVNLSGRANLVPFARDATRFRAIRSLISSRSYSARDPKSRIIILPAGVEESMPSAVGISVMPKSVSASTVSKMGIVLRPSRSRFHTTTVSPAQRSP